MARVTRLGLCAVVAGGVAMSACERTERRGDGAEASEPVFFSYEGDSGRVVFVNDINLVPSDKRDEAKEVDVSHVNLHHEYAASFARAVDEELEELRESGPCANAKSEQTLGTAKRVWHRHGPWIIAAFASLFLVFLTPSMSRMLPGGQWSRFMMMAFPVIFFVTLVAVTATRANDSIQSVDELAGLCDPSTVPSVPAPDQEAPQERGSELNGQEAGATKVNADSRIGELQRMRALITKLYATRAATIDDILAE